MRLTRSNKFRKQKRFFLFQDKKTVKSFLAAYITAGTILFSTSIAYAELGISDYLKNWYQDRVTEVEDYITSSVESEADKQKAQLLRTVREQTEQSVKDLQKYAAEKKETINSNLKQKSEEATDKIAADNQKDVEKAKEQLDMELSPKEEISVSEPEVNEEPSSPDEAPSTVGGITPPEIESPAATTGETNN